MANISGTYTTEDGGKFTLIKRHKNVIVQVPDNSRESCALLTRADRLLAEEGFTQDPAHLLESALKKSDDNSTHRNIDDESGDRNLAPPFSILSFNGPTPNGLTPHMESAVDRVIEKMKITAVERPDHEPLGTLAQPVVEGYKPRTLDTKSVG